MGTSKLSGKPDEMLGDTCDGLASHPGGVAILLVASCYRNRDKLRRCGPLGSCAEYTSKTEESVFTIESQTTSSNMKFKRLTFKPALFSQIKNLFRIFCFRFDPLKPCALVRDNKKSFAIKLKGVLICELCVHV